jgi:hypothetical protein
VPGERGHAATRWSVAQRLSSAAVDVAFGCPAGFVAGPVWRARALQLVAGARRLLEAPGVPDADPRVPGAQPTYALRSDVVLGAVSSSRILSALNWGRAVTSQPGEASLPPGAAEGPALLLLHTLLLSAAAVPGCGRPAEWALADALSACALAMRATWVREAEGGAGGSAAATAALRHVFNRLLGSELAAAALQQELEACVDYGRTTLRLLRVTPVDPRAADMICGFWEWVCKAGELLVQAAASVERHGSRALPHAWACRRDGLGLQLALLRRLLSDVAAAAERAAGRAPFPRGASFRDTAMECVALASNTIERAGLMERELAAGGDVWDGRPGRPLAAVLSELLGELLTGQLLPLSEGGGRGVGPDGGPSSISRSTGSNDSNRGGGSGAPHPPRRLPLLLAAAGCWSLACGRLGGARPQALPCTAACAGCGLARYCGPACQRTHWPLHRAQCLAWRAQLGGEGPTAHGGEGPGQAEV